MGFQLIKKLARPQPAAPAEISAETLRACIASLYELPAITEFKKIASGIERTVWETVTAEGNWLVKVFAVDEAAAAPIREEVRLYQFLRSHGLNVPRVLQSKSGLSVEIAALGERSHPVLVMKAEKLRFLSADSATKSEIQQFARAAARLHRIGKNYPHLQPLVAAAKQKELAQSQKQLHGAYDLLVASPDGKKFDDKELAMAAETDRRLVEFLQAQPPVQSPHSLIHGDYTLRHAPLLENGESYLFDFEDRAWAPVLRDITVAVVDMYRESSIDFPRWREVTNWFLDGYASETGAHRHDPQEVKAQILRQIHNELIFLLGVSKKTGREIAPRGNKRRFELAARLLNHK
jgi:Ser/Thr protein kinase RdoA (MazF antagonist)